MAKKDKRGWIKLYRQIQDSAIWLDDEPFNRRDAWIDLLLMANHEERTIIINGRPVVIQEGQHWTSYRKLALRWGWSAERVRRYFVLLEKLGMARVSVTPNGSLLTIIKYGVFQSGRDTQRDTNVVTDVDTDVVTDVVQTRTNKELLRMKKNKAAPPSSDSGGFEIET